MVKEQFDGAYHQLSNDRRISVWHISLYIALLYKWYKNDLQNPFQITRKETMRMAHIGSIATYHKCIKQLQEYGYIKYAPSYHPSLGSQISLDKTKVK